MVSEVAKVKRRTLSTPTGNARKEAQLAEASDLISVLIVTRDREALFQRALESVVDQTYRPIEIVVIDNASGTPLQIDPDLHDVPIRVVRRDSPANASVTRNEAAHYAKGSLIAYLDDDDFYFPEKLALQASALRRNPNVDFCTGTVEIRYPDKTIESSVASVKDLETLLLHRPVHLNGLLIRKPTFDAVQFNEQMDKYVDVQMVTRLYRDFRGIVVPDTVAVWLVDNRPDQITNTSLLNRLSTLGRQARNWKCLCEEFASLIDQSADLRRLYYRKQAALSFLTFNVKDAFFYAGAAVGIWGGNQRSDKSQKGVESAALINAPLSSTAVKPPRAFQSNQ